MSASTKHQWSDDALTDRGGWIAGERFTCGACGTERRALHQEGVHVMKGHATGRLDWIYFVRGQRVETMPECKP